MVDREKLRLITDFTKQKGQGQCSNGRFLWIRRGGILLLQILVDYGVLFGNSAGIVPVFHTREKA
jgi:hypothetical protein